MKKLLIIIVTLWVTACNTLWYRPYWHDSGWSDHQLLQIPCFYEGSQTCSTNDLRYVCNYKRWMPVVGSCGWQLKCNEPVCCALPRGRTCE